MNDVDLSCREQHRVDDVRAAKLFGLDYVEVSDDQLTLNVFFLGKAPKKLEKANLALSGGRRIRDVRITDLRVQRLKDPTLDDSMEVTVNKPGDFSTYTLSVIATDENGNPTGQPMAGFDPAYSSVQFTFKAGCPSPLDCKPQNVCPPPKRTQPDINYLAKDYESFKQLILDRLALIMPGWTETHEPDIGITLVELLAYVGDYLSYYQDAVATEAYLGTARERISIRRHARLVDYAMHEGCNSRTWITITTDQPQYPLDLARIYFITSFPGAPGNPILNSDDLVNVPASSYDIFQPLAPNDSITIYSAHNEIDFYTWGNCQCCLAQGATSATLVDHWIPVQASPPADTPPAGTTPGSGTTSGTTPGTPGATAPVSSTTPASTAAPTATSDTAATATSDGPPGTVRALNLNVGDILIFEEVLGPKTGNPADADPAHRQAVRLTKVTPAVDPLYHPSDPKFGQPVVEIEWDAVDALTFTLCISSQAPPPLCNCMENVSVARGNVVLVDYGGNSGEDLGTVPTQSATPKCPGCCEPAQIEVLPALFRPVLTQQPLTFSEPLPPPCSAEDFLVQDPRQALPQISLLSIPPGPVVPASAPPASSTNGGPSAQNVATPPLCAKPLFAFSDLDDPTALALRLLHPADPGSQFLFSRLSSSTQQLLSQWNGVGPLKTQYPKLFTALVADLTALLQTWWPRLDLLESGPNDRVFVVEVDNNGYGHLRFGDGSLGYLPDAGAAFHATYRIGNGIAGNIGRETLTYIVFRDEKVSGVSLVPRNPFPATGGTDPEPIEDVKLFAPYAFRNQLDRAITAADYATIAEDNNRRLSVRASLEGSVPKICGMPFVPLQNAKATLRWTGSWYTMLVALDPMDSETAGQNLLDEITAYLAPFNRMGYDLLVSPARYLPLTVGITVCVLPNYLRGHVESAVLDVLSNRVLPDGSLGFFHPDNLSFGDGIDASKLIAAVQAVPGVQNVTLTELERFEISEPARDPKAATEEVPSNSVLSMGPLEIARLDNDPDFPENGILTLDVRGGR